MTGVPPSDQPLSDAPAVDAVAADAVPAGSEPTYEAAAARVEEIIRRLDSGGASLNETLELVREGKTLIELCARELAAVGDALEELRLDELVSRLEQEGSP
jgi:exodeoxyribonuclease VII small subunit